MASYTVFSEGHPIKGTAKEVLESIREENAKDNSELAGMDVDAYTQALIDDAGYFLPPDLLAALENEHFDSKYDQALAYLSQMPTGGVRILVSR